MFKNYLKTALRNLWKSRGFSAINIIGLAIGLATCLLILIFVMDELSYDRYNKKADRIYRLDGEILFGGNHFILAVAPAPAGPAMLRDYPEVEKEARFRGHGGFLVKKGSQNIREDRVVYADSTIFDIFTLPMIDGDPHTALQDPHTIVITESTARKYFNETHVVGRTLVIDDKTNYKITGVIQDIPSQSHFNYDFFVSLSENEDAKRTDQWLSNNYNTYVLLREGTDPKKLEAKFPGMVRKYCGPEIEAAVNKSLDDIVKGGGFIGYSLMPLTSIHLRSNKTAEMGPNGNIQYVYIFSAIAVFILLIACVNFMNLSTARSSNRAKEVGIRKVMGSLRGHLIWQFLSESILISLISMLLALGLAWLMLPVFNGLADKHMSIGLFSRVWLVPALLALVLTVGLLAGSYPAFFLSAFQPIKVLKGNVAAGFKAGWLRNTLVVLQFSISIFLIVGTVVIYRQLGYIRNREIGFDREQVLVVHNGYSLGDGIKAFQKDLAQLPDVKGITVTGFLPTGGYRNDDVFFLRPDLDTKKAISMQRWSVDENYVPVMGMKMTMGRNFSRDFQTDSSAVMINESAARMMSVANPIGQYLYEIDDIKTKKIKTYHIVGVIKDFNFNSMREVVTPMVLLLENEHGSIAFRIHTANIPRLVSQVENEWKKLAPAKPFSYSFMDEDFNAIYKTEQRMGGISLSFSLLAIFIACLGLFGLAAYAAEQRTREIGIRKVLGASVSGLISLLSKDFLMLVLVSMLLAFPFAWWAMHRWLQDFAYRISIGWQVFVLAGLLSVGIALLTVSFQAVKAALMNPVKSLRTE